MEGNIVCFSSSTACDFHILKLKEETLSSFIPLQSHSEAEGRNTPTAPSQPAISLRRSSTPPGMKGLRGWCSLFSDPNSWKAFHHVQRLGAHEDAMGGIYWRRLSRHWGLWRFGLRLRIRRVSLRLVWWTRASRTSGSCFPLRRILYKVQGEPSTPDSAVR